MATEAVLKEVMVLPETFAQAASDQMAREPMSKDPAGSPDPGNLNSRNLAASLNSAEGVANRKLDHPGAMVPRMVLHWQIVAEWKSAADKYSDPE